MPISDRKLILAGNTLHLYKYNYPQVYATNQPKKKSTPAHLQYSEEEDFTFQEKPTEEFDSNSYRSKRTIKHIIQDNTNQYTNKKGRPFKPVFVTLTFRENITRLEQANPIYTNFIKRLNYYIYKEKKNKLHYLVVPEFQKKTRQAVHYHAIFFNLPFVKNVYDEFNRIWEEGNVNVKTVHNTLHLSNYIVKYITKQLPDQRTFNKKSFFTSHQIKRPIVLKQQELVNTIISQFTPKENFTKTFNSGTLITDYKCLTISQEKLNTLYSLLDLSQSLNWPSIPIQPRLKLYQVAPIQTQLITTP